MQTSLRNTSDNTGFQPVGKVALPVGYRMPGNVIESVLIEFSVFQKENVYQVQPLCSRALLLLTNLLPSFRFSIQNDNIVVERMCFKELAAAIMEKINQPESRISSAADR